MKDGKITIEIKTKKNYQEINRFFVNNSCFPIADSFILLQKKNIYFHTNKKQSSLKRIVHELKFSDF